LFNAGIHFDQDIGCCYSTHCVYALSEERACNRTNLSDPSSRQGCQQPCSRQKFLGPLYQLEVRTLDSLRFKLVLPVFINLSLQPVC
jgi:hypothetical protein